jgi:hypothetical protein
VGKQYETPEDLISEVRNIIEGIRRMLWKVFSNPGREDCWIAGIPVMNMCSKLYILVWLCLSNFARVQGVRVNNGHRVPYLVGRAYIVRGFRFATESFEYKYWLIL